MNAKTLYGCNEIKKPRFYVLQTTARPPMSFSWEVNYPTRAFPNATQIMHIHFAKLNLTNSARICIRIEYVRVRVFELQGNAFPHHPFCVDSIHQRLRWGFKQIAFGRFDHQ